MEDIIFRETILFSTFMNKSENFLNSKIFILNDVNTYKSIFI